MSFQHLISNITAVLILFICVPFSYATDSSPVKVKVIKSVTGKSLIIYDKSTSVKPGIYSLVSATKEEPGELSLETKDHFISLSLDASLLSQKTTPNGGTASAPVDIKSMASNLTYGWNKQTWEWGLFLSYAFDTVATVDNKTLVAGLLFDKNFSPNTLESEYVFGVRIQAGAGQEDSSAYTKAASVTLIQPALYLKWFGLNPNVGMTTELGYKLQESTTDIAKIQTQGTFLRLGVTSYY